MSPKFRCLVETGEGQTKKAQHRNGKDEERDAEASHDEAEKDGVCTAGS